VQQRPHIIRLRRPWELAEGPARPGAAPGTCWTLRRGFHRPSGLQAGDRIVLIVDLQNVSGLRSICGLTLNEQPLPFSSVERTAARSDLQGRLQAYNVLTVEFSVSGDTLAADLWQRLERDALAAGKLCLEISSG
jgi:hypothetical protein